MSHYSTIILILVISLALVLVSNTMARYWVKRIETLNASVAPMLADIAVINAKIEKHIHTLAMLNSTGHHHNMGLPPELIAQMNASMQRDIEWRKARAKAQLENNHHRRRFSDKKPGNSNK